MVTLFEEKAITPGPTAAERWAMRVVSKTVATSPAWWLAYWVVASVASWSRHEFVSLTFELTMLCATSVLRWERHGFRQLIDRYEGELRHLRATADVANRIL